jgi:lysozyme family protein
MSFDDFMSRVLGNEGGYVCSASDPGGETKWGISKRSYPSANIRDLTKEQAIELYRRDFWLKPRINELPEQIAYQVLDAAINSGSRQAIEWLQKSLEIPDDGVIGPQTLEAARAANQTKVAITFLANRLDFLTALPTWVAFGRGWARRIATNMRFVE